MPFRFKPRDWQNVVYNNVIRRIEALFIYFIVTGVKNIVSHTEAFRGLSYIDVRYIEVSYSNLLRKSGNCK